MFLCRNSWYTDLSPWSWDNVSSFSMKNLFFVEVIYVSTLGINCTQDPIEIRKNYADSCVIFKATNLTLILILDHQSIDHLALILSSWSVLWDLFLDAWSSWSCSSMNSSNHQPISSPVLGWNQSVQTPSCLFVWTTCSSEEIYQLSLLASKHYILKRMNLNK